MACDALIWGLLFVGCSVQILWAISEDDSLEYMSKEEREALKFVLFCIYYTIKSLYRSFHNHAIVFYREEARDMFYHAYNAYMVNSISQSS